jgi:hypothetical protein
MPAWLLAALLKIVLPEVLKLLVNAKLISQFEADLARGAVNLEQGLETINTYRNYPGDQSGPTNMPNFGVTQPTK